MSRRRALGGAKSATVTLKIHLVKAKCPANQEAVDRLQEHLIQAEQNPNSKITFTLKRALKSLKDCLHAVTTLQEALDLKYVGPRLAKIIVPHAAPVPSKAKSPSPPPANRVRSVCQPTAQPPGLPASVMDRATSTASRNAGAVPRSSKPVAATLTAKEKAYATAKRQAENLFLPPKGPWKVILLVDGREHKSKQVVSRIRQAGIPCEERHLPIGDMAWIARCEIPKEGGKPDRIEVLVGTILERKEVSDLVGSIFGTRFSEQRLRLQQCGLPQVLYLVEGDLNSQVNCPAETMRMAMMETRVQMGFSVVQSKHLQDTIQLLKRLHRRIVQRTFPHAFSDQELPTYNNSSIAVQGDRPRKRRKASSLLEQVFDTPPIPPFGTPRFVTYNELKTKVLRDREAGTKPVRAVYLAMLKQVATLSQKKCQAIAQEYPTFRSLLEAFDHSEAPARMVQHLPVERRTLGPKSAAELHVACCTQRDGTLENTASGGTHRHRSNAPALAPKAPLPPSAAHTTSTGLSGAAARTITAAAGSRAAATPASGINDKSRSTCSILASSPSDKSSPSTCLDLTQDSPQPNKISQKSTRNDGAALPKPRSSGPSGWSSDDDDDLDDDAFFAKLAEKGRRQREGNTTASRIPSNTTTTREPPSSSSLARTITASASIPAAHENPATRKTAASFRPSSRHREIISFLDSPVPAPGKRPASLVAGMLPPSSINFGTPLSLRKYGSRSEEEQTGTLPRKKNSLSTLSSGANLPAQPSSQSSIVSNSSSSLSGGSKPLSVHHGSIRPPTRESFGDSTIPFSSPSTTASWSQSPAGGTNGLSPTWSGCRSADKKLGRAEPPGWALSSVSRRSSAMSGKKEASIVVIDSSDDETEEADAKPPAAATTTLSQGSNFSLDLRARVAKTLGRETIEID